MNWNDWVAVGILVYVVIIVGVVIWIYVNHPKEHE